MARQGVSKQLMRQVQNHLGFTQKEMAHLLHLTPRTVQRMEEEQLLPPFASGQLLELARLFRRATDVLGDPEVARQWLRTSLQALNNAAPFDLLDTPVGIQWVFTLLGRIAYGIYS